MHSILYSLILTTFHAFCFICWCDVNKKSLVIGFIIYVYAIDCAV